MNGHAVAGVEARRPRWARETAPEDYDERERGLELIRAGLRHRRPMTRRGMMRRRRPRIDGRAETYMLLGVALLLALLSFLQAFWVLAP